MLVVSSFAIVGHHVSYGSYIGRDHTPRFYHFLVPMVPRIEL